MRHGIQYGYGPYKILELKRKQNKSFPPKVDK